MLASVGDLATQLFRLQARTIRLPGTGRLAKRLVPMLTKPDGSGGSIVPYQDGLLTVDLGSFIEWSVYVYGGYDVGSVRLLQRVQLAPDATIFDIGANIGVFTVPLARRFPDGQVHAFEPHPSVRRRLTDNLILNNLANVTVNSTALGARPGSAKLYGSTGNNQGWASTNPHESLVSEGEPDQFDVVVDTVDAHCVRSGVERVDLIKIDVEGAELDVLKGALGTLQRDKPIVYLEVEGDSMANHGALPSEVYELFTGLDYRVWENRASDDQLTWDLRLLTPDTLLDQEYVAPNWLAMPVRAMAAPPPSREEPPVSSNA